MTIKLSNEKINILLCALEGGALAQSLKRGYIDQLNGDNEYLDEIVDCRLSIRIENLLTENAHLLEDMHYENSAFYSKNEKLGLKSVNGIWEIKSLREYFENGFYNKYKLEISSEIEVYDMCTESDEAHNHYEYLLDSDIESDDIWKQLNDLVPEVKEFIKIN